MIEKNIDLNMEGADTDIYTSQIHPYPAKFIPQIPKFFIDNLTEEGDTILDPFNGSGTTTMVSSVSGRKSYGFDLNPLAAMIAKVKSRKYKISDIEKQIEDFKQIEEDMKNLRKTNTKREGRIKNIENKKVNIPNFPDRYDWFLPENLNQLGFLKKEIENIQNQKIRNLFLVNMSGIIKNVSRTNEDYTYIGDNMLPTSETNSVEPDNNVYNVYKKFIRKVEMNLDRIKNFQLDGVVEPKIFCKDSRKMEDISKNIDLTITSPPYVNAVDYARYHRLSFYWLELPIRETRDKEIGARSKRGRKNAIEDYFREIKQVYEKVYNKTKENGFFIIVVGNSQHKKEEIKTSKRTLEKCKKIGFKHKKTLTREISNQTMSQKKITKEYIHILEK